MSKLFAVVPKQVVKQLLSEWLTLGEVANLDSAVCTNKFRSDFLQLLRSSSMTLNRDGLVLKKELVEWILERNFSVKLTALQPADILTCDSRTRTEFLALVGKSVVELQYMPDVILDTTPLWLELAHYCNTIEGIAIRSCPDASVFALMARNPRLKRLCLGISTIASVTLHESHILSHVLGMCPDIVDLEVRCQVPPQSVDMFFRGNIHNLCRLCLPYWNCSQDDLQKLSSVCCRLSELHVGTFTSCNATETPFTQMATFRASVRWVPQHESQLADMMPNLSALILIPVDSRPPLNDSDLGRMLDIFPQVTTLCVLKQFEYDCLRNLSKRVSSTTELDAHPLQQLYAWYTGSTDQLMSRCPHLKTVGAFNTRTSEKVSVYSGVSSLLLISSSSTDAFCFGARGLREFGARDCSSMTDQGLIALAKQNPSLQVLIIRCTEYRAHGVTDLAVWTLLKHCPCLHTFEFLVGKRDAAKDFDMNKLLKRFVRKNFPNIKHFECSIGV